MYQFFIREGQIDGDTVTIMGGDAHHMRDVLRMKAGERFRVSTDLERNFICEVADVPAKMPGEGLVRMPAKQIPTNSSDFHEGRVVAKIICEDEEGTEPPNKIYLFQALPKGDKMEIVVQKAVELGVYAIVPVAMRHCVVRLDEKKAAAKAARWQGIAAAAAGQSNRGIVPQVYTQMGWDEALAMFRSLDVRIVPYENAQGMQSARDAFAAIRPGQAVGVMIGPEGGFAPEEIAEASECGTVISLGRRILRTETAGMAALSMLNYVLEP